jgi:co-chaperonin GroES (HSP10)
MTMEQTPHSHRLTRENNGIADIDMYQNCPLPEDYEITELLGDIIMAEYADVAEDGQSLIRNGIVLPQSVVEQKAWRIGKVVLVGPDTRQVKVGQNIIFPGDRGLVGLNRNGRTVVFLNEQRIFGICAPHK